MLVYPSFSDAIAMVEKNFLRRATPVHSKFWQATNVATRPEAQMMEDPFVSVAAPIPLTVARLESEIRPNSPWAENHFRERVGGRPVNPGKTWKEWPWSNSADGHRDEKGRFNHNYMERYWPKYAGEPMEKYWPEGVDLKGLEIGHSAHHGIRYAYGDLADVVLLIAKDPLTRQAYLPVFFPEDTGAVHGGRVPCSIGYHFMMRGKSLHCTYQLRSCDLFRHFRDDLYLTARLVQWVCAELSMEHNLHFEPGVLYTHIASLHMFINDYRTFSARLSG